jgi:HK97 family phage portal protein
VSLLGLLRGADTSEARTLTDWGDWTPSRSSTTVNETTQYNLSTVWACQTLIADAIATMPVDTFRKTADGREPVPNPSFLDTPNPDTSKIDYDTQRVLSLLGWGNAYSLLVRRGGSSDPMDAVVERWLLNPDLVQVRRSTGGPVEYSVAGKPMPAGNIQHIRGYTRPGHLVGMSCITNFRMGLGLAMSAEQTAENLYSNGLNPSGVVEIPSMEKETSKSVIERIREQFQEWYGGPRNAGKPMVLVGGTTWKSMSVTPVDAQFLETRKFQVEEVARWFRVTLHEIQHVEKQSSWGSGIEQLSIGLVRRTLMPWLARLEEADSALLQKPRFVKYNIDVQVRADIKTRYEAHKMGREGGWLNADDVRTLEDLPPLPDGKGQIYLQPLNYVEAGTEPPEPAPVPGTGEGGIDGSVEA